MRLFGLVGFPLGHSFSKEYFTRKFEREDIPDCQFENFPLTSIQELDKVLLHPGLEGLAVTIPYKEQVIPGLTSVDEVVKKTGACNCIRVRGTELSGFNTDVIGFERSLQNKLQAHHNAALVLGTGGAAKAVGFVLEKLGIPFRYVSRKPVGEQLGYRALDAKTIYQHPLIINASPIGMHPEVNAAPELDYEALTPQHFLFDLVYNPQQTLFLKKAIEKGSLAQNGYDMLVYQAEENWKIWND
jgi:shikimate dehydrogenase